MLIECQPRSIKYQSSIDQVSIEVIDRHSIADAFITCMHDPISLHASKHVCLCDVYAESLLNTDTWVI